MKRARLVVKSAKGRSVLFGLDAKLVDADTGEPIDCLRGLNVDFPLKGVVVANAEIAISEVEVISDGEA